MINLSSREKEILTLIAHEHTVQEIADKLYISSNTAHSHRKNLFRKMEVKNMAGLVRKGFELGFLQLSHLVNAIIILVFTGYQVSYGQDNQQQFIDQTTVSYDNCTGVAKVKFPVRENYSICGQANNLRHIAISDLNVANGIAIIYALSKDYVTGTYCSTPNDGQVTISGCRTYDKCKFNSSITFAVVNGVGDQRFVELTIPNLENEAFGGDIEFGFTGWYDLECCEGTTNPSSTFGFELNFSKKWQNGQLSATIDDKTPSISSVAVGDCNTTTVNWNDQSDPGGCSGANWTTEIWRSVQGDNNFIKVGEKKFSPFTDNNSAFMMTEGVSYEYKLRPVWTLGQRIDYGKYSGVRSVTIPDHDGRISGKVNTLGGDGVPGVLVKAILTNPLDLTGCPNITAPTGGYTVTTEEDGTFTIQKVYYGIAGDPDANYMVVGILEGHKIDTAFNVILNDDNAGISNNRQNIMLTDSTAVPLEGKVTDGQCPIAGVQVQGFSTNPMSTALIVPTMTNDTGGYKINLPGPGEYDIKIIYRDHTETKTITVDLNPDDLNFIYPDTAMLSGYVLAGCQEFIGTTQVQALSNDCIIATTNTDNSGYYQMILPKRDVKIVVGPFTPLPGSGLSGARGDSASISIESDTTLDFVFRKPIAVTAAGIPGLSCAAIPYPILHQREAYTIQFSVTEGTSCPADTGFVTITDFIGSNNQVSQIDTMIPVKNGYAYYTLIAGDPNILAPFTKSMTYVAHVGNANTPPKTVQVIVTGAVKRGNTFATTSPQIPYLILRDPPGDGSYAFL
ncbi:MAG: helix-turn-helix transcriptional regulator, partial [Saprospiraceae bacterium]|nr:helix-turn-helix transcriptional regulator [Saprospiraceae bacterium]